MNANRIAGTRELIRQAVFRIRKQFIPETITLETDINAETTLYVEITVYTCIEGYATIEITGVDVLKDTIRRTCNLVNIANMIGEDLDQAALVFNYDSIESFKDWSYRKKHIEI